MEAASPLPSMVLNAVWADSRRLKKLTAVPTAAVPMPTMGAVTAFDMPLPMDCRPLPSAATCFCVDETREETAAR